MRRSREAAAGVVLAALAIGAGCSDDTPREPVFPADYAATYMEVRDCRQSGDHDLNMVRVVADPAAIATYMDRAGPFPEGAIVIKEEYEFGDMTCAGSIRQWTVMQKLSPGADPDLLDWYWERVDSERRVVEANPTRCASCHRGCGIPPDGHDGTCTVP